jgi:hypothetical protein
MGRKFTLHKAQKQSIEDIGKGKQYTIHRALGVGKSLKRPSP